MYKIVYIYHIFFKKNKKTKVSQILPKAYLEAVDLALPDPNHVSATWVIFLYSLPPPSWIDKEPQVYGIRESPTPQLQLLVRKGMMPPNFTPQQMRRAYREQSESLKAPQQ